MDTNALVIEYKKLLNNSSCHQAYEFLMRYFFRLKLYFERESAKGYIFSNISAGYMDYSYFPFYNDFLKGKKLRYGIVLNHREMRFELWLMGQNAIIQKKYWDLLKNSKWNKKLNSMPKYSVLELVLVNNPDFGNLDFLSEQVFKQAFIYVEEINKYLTQIDK